MDDAQRIALQDPRLFPGEQEAVTAVLQWAEVFGYANMISHLTTAWAIKLVRENGLTKEAAIRAVTGRHDIYAHLIPEQPAGPSPEQEEDAPDA